MLGLDVRTEIAPLLEELAELSSGLEVLIEVAGRRCGCAFELSGLGLQQPKTLAQLSLTMCGKVQPSGDLLGVRNIQ